MSVRRAFYSMSRARVKDLMLFRLSAAPSHSSLILAEFASSAARGYSILKFRSSQSRDKF
ncbi:MAG: hypothetical protein B6D41_12275 [Chloroflexi bacterium UTCFX4]|nr:MAG: hypothetical protein B6D41_12275 [Chloroflexi bacterium UTCFX4]